MDNFDFAVIGAGPGGYVAAIRAAQLGMKVVLIEERDRLGGTCLNVGCVPSKALLESSELFQVARDRLEEHGIGASGVQLDLAKMMERKSRIVTEVTDGLGLLMKKNKITVISGRGVLAGDKRIKVSGPDGATELEASHIVLAMGSVPVELPGLPFDGKKIISSTEALELTEVPGRMVVVGGGAIGLELGSVWKRLGAEVTVVELLPRIAIFADVQLSKGLKKELAGQGIQILLESKVIAADTSGDEIRVTVEGKNGESELTCDTLLVAVGRRPCLDTAGLEEAGVTVDQGRVKVDRQWRTSVPDIYAIGDLIHGPMLAHKAEDEGVAVAELAAGRPGHVNYGAIPNVIYTMPELAQVGLTEAEAREQGIPVKVGRSYFKANARAKSLAEEEGLVKVIAHAETDRILGVHILGTRASDMIAEAVLAMEFQASSEDIVRTCHAHPTLSEIFREAAMAVDRRSIHG
jgi:dihydrolipoamide dehydrogenase